MSHMVMLHSNMLTSYNLFSENDLLTPVDPKVTPDLTFDPINIVLLGSNANEDPCMSPPDAHAVAIHGRIMTPFSQCTGNDLLTPVTPNDPRSEISTQATLGQRAVHS